MMLPAAITPDVTAAIQRAAIAAYPLEMCGAVTPDGFVQFTNKSPTPRDAFDCRDEQATCQAAGRLLALVHSHPDGPEAPSELDVGSQIAMDVPWGIVVCTKDAAGTPYYWGDSLDPPPLIGRPFRHGPSGTDGRGDCGALVRDWYRIERGIHIPDFARGDDWWLTPGRDLYNEHFAAAGFKAVPVLHPDPKVAVAPEIGDVILIQWRVPASNLVPNHAGIFLGDGLLLHHLGNRLSRPESLMGWRKFIRTWLRHAA